MKKNYFKLLLLGGLMLFTCKAQAQTTFDYTGSEQTYIVPAGVVLISIEAYGAQGGTADGGEGGYAYGELAVTPGQTLYIYVGEQGNSTNIGSGVSVGGWNGGGDGGSGTSGSSGGGASDVRVGGTTLADRVIVAGGGGGMDFDGTSNTPGGDGGGLDGLDGTIGGASGTASTGGTQTAGGTGGVSTGYTGNPGALGVGGATVLFSGSTYQYGGGGGGGYYGGASGHPWCSGGGGSSYIGGVTAGVTTAGGKTGNGQIIITELCTGLTYTVSDDTVCVGDEVTLDATSTLGGTITWDGGVTNGTPFTPPAGSTTYNATSSDAGDCGLSVTIFVGDYPTIDAGSDVTFCPGDEVTLTASGTATDWSWDGGITDGVPFSPSGTTTYTLTGTIDSTGCEATDDVEVAEVIIDNTVTATGSDLIANQTGATYQWLECPAMTPVTGETSQTYASVPDGDYAVEVTLDGCVDTSDCQLVHVGIEEFYQEVLLYPNPTTGKFTVTVEGAYSYEVTNILGKTIFNGNAIGTKEFNLSDFANGAYFVKVSNADELRTIKVIKR